jgi:hypothetical protein
MIREEEPTGVLFSAGFPVFKNSSGVNAYLQDKRNDEISNHFPDENSLSLFNAVLTNSLYSLLSGQRIAILASELRKTTAVDLLSKLNDLRICKRKEPVVWIEDSTK